MQIRWRESAGGCERCVLVLAVAVAARGVYVCVYVCLVSYGNGFKEISLSALITLIH